MAKACSSLPCPWPRTTRHAASGYAKTFSERLMLASPRSGHDVQNCQRTDTKLEYAAWPYTAACCQDTSAFSPPIVTCLNNNDS